MGTGHGHVRVGYFAGLNSLYSDMELRLMLNPFAPVVDDFISANFVDFGDGRPGLGTPGTVPGFYNRTIGGIVQPGRLFGTITGLQPNGDAPNFPYLENGVPVGSQIFLLIYNAPTPETSTEMGIFSASQWTMPANSFVSIHINTVHVDTVQEVYRGILGQDFLMLGGVIPEPGSAGFMLMALGGLTLRRRRR